MISRALTILIVAAVALALGFILLLFGCIGTQDLTACAVLLTFTGAAL